MPRPSKEKRVCRLPAWERFAPETDRRLNSEALNLHQLTMTVDEYETIRLMDYLGYTQEECARQMEVGRTTVQAVYSEARKKLARFLVEGSRLEISGGCFRLCGGGGCIQGKYGCFKQKKTGGFQMKVAVTYENGEVFQHFGHTEQFKVYDVENGKIVSSQVVDTNGSGHGALAGFLKEYQVEVLICGGIGGGARNALGEAGIQLYPGASGDADRQVEAFLAGSLSYDPDTMCNHHKHASSDCGEQDHSCGHHCG